MVMAIRANTIGDASRLQHRRSTGLTVSEIEAQTARMERREGRRDRPEHYGSSGSSKFIRQIRRRPAA